MMFSGCILWQARCKFRAGGMGYEAARRAYRAMGAELKQWHLLMGQYNAVVISEAPDDEAAARVSLAVGALRNVTTETMRAFDEGEFAAMVAGMP